jgi:hypothetical protein
MKFEIIRTLTIVLKNSGLNIAKYKSRIKISKLYNLIVEGETDEDEIKRKIYPNIEKQEQFRVLKKRYFEFLVDKFLLTEFRDKDFSSKTEFNSYLILKTLLISFWTIRRKSFNTYISILEELYLKAKPLGQIEVDIFLIQELRHGYGLFISNENKFELYSQRFNEISEQYQSFLIIKAIYTDLARVIIKPDKRRISKKELRSLELRFLSVEPFIKSSQYYFIRFYYHNSKYMIHLIKNEHNVLIPICNDALSFFNKKRAQNPLPVYQFHQNRGIAFLLVKDYNHALADFIKCLEFKPRVGTTSWQFTYSYIFHTQILKQDYQKAYEILAMVINHYSFKNLDISFREPWYLKEAFIHFLIKTEKVIPENSPDVRIRNFRLTRFMNEVTVYSKDKTGFNITINIIQMLFLLIGEQYDQILNKLESLKQYNYKYLKKPEFQRSSSFIKMLLKIPEGDYSADLIKQKSSKFYQELLDNPSDYSEHAISLEIIPYEQLWEEILELFN